MFKIKVFIFFVLSWTSVLLAQTPVDYSRRSINQEIDRNRAEQSWLLQGAYPASNQNQARSIDEGEIRFQEQRREGAYERQRITPSFSGQAVGEEFYPSQPPSLSREVERNEEEQKWLYQDAYPRSSAGRPRD